MRVANRSSARRTSTRGARVGVLMCGPPGEGRDEDRAGCRRPQRVSGSPAGRSGVLDRGDLELEDDLVADQDAAGLQRGVPGDAVVLAADGDRAVEADALVAERVL